MPSECRPEFFEGRPRAVRPGPWLAAAVALCLLAAAAGGSAGAAPGPASSGAAAAGPAGSATASSAPAASAPAASGDAAQVCLRSYDESQRLRQAGKLVEARVELLRCSQEDCPSVVKSDCLPWLGDVESAIPSIVVAAKNARGQDTTEVRVTVDGKLAAAALDGRPIPLDPGAHHLRFEHTGAAAIEQDIVLQVSVRNRPVEVSFAPKGASAAGEPSEERGEPVAGYVLTGFGLLGLGNFALFGLLGKGEADTYNDTCAPTKSCDPDEVAGTRTKLLVADVSLGVGLAALGVGIGLILYNKLSGPDEPTPSARLALRPTAGGAVGGLTVEF